MPLREFALIFLQFLFGLLEWSIIIHVIYSWVKPAATSSFYRLITSIVAPIYRFVRRIIPPFGMLDLTPLFCLIGLEFLEQFLMRLVVG